MLYILYGTFGMVFAGASFGYAWDHLVVDFWTEAFGIVKKS
jgi:hypothetical protein